MKIPGLAPLCLLFLAALAGAARAEAQRPEHLAPALSLSLPLAGDDDEDDDDEEDEEDVRLGGAPRTS